MKLQSMISSKSSQKCFGFTHIIHAFVAYEITDQSSFLNKPFTHIVALNSCKNFKYSRAN